MTRRSKLIRFINPWVDARPQNYEPRIGTPGLGCTLSLNDLSDEALERLADRICRLFWIERRINRENRAIRSRAS